MADNSKIVKLAVDSYRGKIAGNYSQTDSMEVLHNALIAANNGSTKLDGKAVRDGKCNGLFSIVEEIIKKTAVEGLTGDEFFNQMVEYRNLGLGDQNEFVVPDNSLFVVSDVAEGTQGIRRQRLNGAQTVRINTQLKVIKIYEELNRVLSGRIDFNDFIARISKSFANKAKEDIYAAFKGSFSSLPPTFAQSGSFTEDGLLTLVEHVEAATGENAVITGTKSALRKVTQANISDSAKEDIYGMGYYGKFDGVPMVAMKQVHKVGTYDFALTDDDIYVLAGNSKPIKFVTEGDSLIIPGNPVNNQLLEQEFLYTDRYGVGVVINQLFGILRISA